ncbi:hypothetical protein GUJ93_ZPchr0115g2739 [Zizania palustris]|uniref:THO complex subunit 2 n=1 Tax=Zizania palustris TaxID=103762 RepID=A0A8J5QZH1_ZIZPA|nr:hypothetical protein GUJ93_ZPchr0115g2739 [Zizania palustris]
MEEPVRRRLPRPRSGPHGALPLRAVLGGGAGGPAPQKCRVALDSVVFVEESRRGEVGSVLADIIAHLGQDVTISGEYRNRLVKMTKSFVELSLIVPRLLQERCEEEFLWEVEQSKSKGQDLKAKEVRVNTRLLYQQTKFNLLREESEGYAKLVTLLCQIGSELACQNSSSVTISIIKSLIGHFDLDPNRVFGIVLECFELYPDNTIFYQLIPLFPKSHAAQYWGSTLLVKSGLIDLDSVYAHLLPNDDEAFEHYDSFVARRIDEASKIGKINLAATGKDLMDDEKQEITIDLYTALEMENNIVEERALEIEKNQKLGLLLGFLSVHDWDHAQLLFERLAHLNPVEHIEICEGLFRIIIRTISSTYDIVFETFHKMDTAPSQSFSVDLPKSFSKCLLLVDHTFIVTHTYFRRFAEYSKHTTSHQKTQPLIPANPAVDMEIWGVLSLLPYEARYRMYGEWEKDTEQNPIVLAARQTAKLDTRRLLKRLAKENLKQLGRMVEAYRDMITPVVDAFKYLTQLEFDIVQYIVIERLAQGGREKLKDDGLNLSDWLQCLASFWGHLCKKHHSVELKSLFQYIVNQLKKGSGIELVVLEELIQQMANVQYTENMTEEQVDAMAGSETLRLQASLFGSTRNYKVLNKTTNKLRDSLLPKTRLNLRFPCYCLFVSIGPIAPTSYVQLIPPLEDLIHKYHIEPDVAFLIYRPVMRLFKSTTGGDTCWPLDDNEEGESVSCDDLILHLDTPHKSIMWSGLLSTVRTTLPSKPGTSDESVYERECGNKPGFAVYFRDPNSQRVSYCQFVRVHWKWSSRITKISSIFPVIRKSGVNIEKRVAKLRGDEREDLKVLATGVAAALAARKSSWLSEEVFGMGYLDLKQRLTKTVPGNQSTDSLMAKDQSVQNLLRVGMKGAPRGSDEPPKLLSDEGVKVLKPTAESETRAPQKRVAHSAGKVSKHDVVKEDTKSGKSTSRVSASSQRSMVLAGTHAGGQPNTSGESTGLIDSNMKQKRSAPADEQERGSKRKKGEIEARMVT